MLIAPSPRRFALAKCLISDGTCCGALTFAPPACAQAYVVNLDPAQTKITFALDTTLHDVHGTFRLKSGQIHFDKDTGKASGAIIVDAQSGDTDNKSRDKK